MSKSINEINPETAPFLAQRFVDFAQSIEGITLDYSENSIEQVDEIIEGMRKSGLSVKDVYLNLLIAGCYIGEIFIRKHTAKWVKAKETSYGDSASGAPIVIEYAINSYTSPIDKVIKRLENGQEDYLPYYYQVFCKLIEEQ